MEKNFIILNDKLKSRLDTRDIRSYFLSKSPSQNHSLVVYFHKVEKPLHYYYENKSLMDAQADIDKIDAECIGMTERESNLLK